MKSKHSVILILVLSFLVAGAAVLRAQDKADYDASKKLKFDATVTGYTISGMHIELKFDAADEKGTVQHWTCEADNIKTDYRFTYGNDEAWDELTFRPGDKITITFNPSKQGVKGVGLLLRADLPGDNSVFRLQK